MVREVERRIGVTQSRVVSYHRPSEIRRNLYSRSMAGSFGVAGAPNGRGSLDRPLVRQGLEDLLGASGFAYLWWPGRVGMPSMIGWTAMSGQRGIVGPTAGLDGRGSPGPIELADQLASWPDASSPAVADPLEKDVPSDMPRTNIAD
jgi:hypothetical protein